MVKKGIFPDRDGIPDAGNVFSIQKMVSRAGKPFFWSKKGIPDPGSHFLDPKNAFLNRESIF